MKHDRNTTLRELVDIFMDFSKKRGWDKRRIPQQLAKSLIIEAGELLEEYQWMSDSKSQATKSKSKIKNKISGELVDILYYLITLFDVYKLDITSSVHKKLKKLSNRYKEL